MPMRPYMSPTRLTEDPLDGPYPTRKSALTGAKKRKALKRKMRSHKKGARQHNLAAQVKTLSADSLLPDWKG